MNQEAVCLKKLEKLLDLNSKATAVFQPKQGENFGISIEAARKTSFLGEAASTEAFQAFICLWRCQIT